MLVNLSMKKIKNSLFILCVGFIFGNFAHAEERNSVTVWPVIEIDNQIVTSNEVKEYINSVTISSDLHKELFNQAGHDYTVYKSQKNLLIENLFQSTLQRMALTRLLQAQALQFKDRRYFALTKMEMSALLDKTINAALVPFKKDGTSLEDTKIAFVESLKLNGFPYDSTNSSEDIFKIWSKRIKVRLSEDYRQKEAVRYLCSLENCDKVSPAIIFANHRKYFESNNYLALRYTSDVTLKGRAAFDNLFENGLGIIPHKNADGSIAKIKHFFYLGKIVNERVELMHVNDYNLLGSLGEKLGYPHTDDFGRTSGFIFTYAKNGTAGNLTIQLENWLFNEKLPPVNGIDQQNVEEESTLRVVSRHFLDEKGDKWVVVGIAATDRIQQAAIGTWIQENFHKLNSHSHPRNSVSRDGVENYVQGLFGIGGKYSLIDTPHVDLVLTGEGLLEPTVGQFSENNITVKSALDLNIYGKTKELPIFQLGLFAEYKLKANGQLETVFGGKVTVAMIINRTQLQAGLFVEQWDGELDRRYERAASWTMGIMLSVSILPKKNIVEYEFN